MIGRFATPVSVSSSTVATTTPTISVTGGLFGKVTATVNNYSSYTNPNFNVEAKVGSTTTVLDTAVRHTLHTDSTKLSNTILFDDVSTTTGTRTLYVKAQEFGDYTPSASATATYDVSFLQAAYIRLLIQSSAGANTTLYAGFEDIRFYTAQQQTGTAYPTTNLTSNTSETGIVVSSGYAYSATYDTWKAADNSLSSFWWSISVPSGSSNWWQIHFEPGTYPTAPIIKSIYLRANNSSATNFRILTSNTGAFSGEQTDHGLFSFVNNTNNYYG